MPNGLLQGWIDFTADSTLAYSSGAMQLSWQTVNESNAYGYHILRAQGDGPAVRLTAEIVPARKRGQADGAAYSFADASVKAGVSYGCK